MGSLLLQNDDGVVGDPCQGKYGNIPNPEVPSNSTPLNRIAVTEDEKTCDTDTCTCVYPADSCSEYYRCENGVAYKEKCPEGLLLNQENSPAIMPKMLNVGPLCSKGIISVMKTHLMVKHGGRGLQHYTYLDVIIVYRKQFG
ncbi:hypothetical protein CEXT_544141 [Caerostris extrusa]|uniref:Chitin-binding type-2 domain-containing protein n=1 Tax=Caerostris extrusa TaxID=172846 RepID=A0AAV4VFS6_CAEEX|nr:hypothetical protein CEXT_544141 [Caerostris extrusa]